MKTNKLIPTILTSLLLSAGSVLATAWIAEPALTNLQLVTQQACWKEEPYGLRPACISGYETPAGIRFAVIWEKQSPGLTWHAVHGRTAAQLESHNSTQAASNRQLIFLSGYTLGGVRYYNAIWEQRSSGNSVFQAGITKQGLETAHSVRHAQGYTLTYVSTFTEGNAPRYNAVWAKGNVGPADEYAVRYGLTKDRFESDLTLLSGQGYRLTAQTISYEAGEQQVAAVFRRPLGVGWWNASSITANNFIGENWNAYYQGYRPSFVAAHRENGTVRFNAVWTHDGGLPPVLTDPVEQVIHDYMDTNNVAGLSLAVSLHGRLIYAKSFGMAYKAGDEWMTPHHRLRIGSVSKMLTATGVLRQKETGILTSLDRKVFGPGSLFNERYGKQRPYDFYDTKITIRHLLTHTSGWHGDSVFNPDRDAQIDSILDDLAGRPPGTAGAFDYKNDHFLVLGRVIEHISGKTYQKYVNDSLLTPCGISGMEIGGNTLAERKPGEVVYYSTNGNTYYRDLQHGDSAGGWIARPIDLLLFLRRFDGSAAQSDLISQDLFDQMVTDFVGMGYGFATMLRPDFRSWRDSHWGHDGAIEGSRAYLRHYNSGLGLAVVCNQDTSGFYTMVDDVGTALNVHMNPTQDYFRVVNAAYDGWTESHFDEGVRSKPGLKSTVWGSEADPDGDGMPNALEAGLGRDPRVANPAPYKQSIIGNHHVLRWKQPLPVLNRGVQLVCEVAYSPNPELQIWEPGPPIQVAAGVSEVGYVTMEARVPVGDGPLPVLRLRATTP